MHRSPLTRALERFSLLALCALGCTEAPQPDPSACDEECRDNVALRGLRETIKLVYNLTLQGNPVGEQDELYPCPLGGGARVHGFATSNPVHGATEVDLTYELLECRYLQRDEEPPENYDLRITGVLQQKGTIAVQPSASTALILSSDSMTIEGDVYDPFLPYTAADCAVQLAQNGNLLSGTLCERIVGVDL